MDGGTWQQKKQTITNTTNNSMNIDELKQRAAGGDAEAQFELGKAYECGRDVVVNLWESVKWYRLAAEHGVVDAQYNLGVCYYEGTGVEEDLEEDLEEAVKWWQLAAEKGNEDAKEVLEKLQNE